MSTSPCYDKFWDKEHSHRKYEPRNLVDFAQVRKTTNVMQFDRTNWLEHNMAHSANESQRTPLHIDAQWENKTANVPLNWEKDNPVEISLPQKGENTPRRIARRQNYTRDTPR